MAKLTYKDENGNVQEIPIDPSKSILEMLEAQGIDYPFSCMAGACSSCKIKVHKNKDKLELDKFGTPLMPVEDNECLSCVCGISEKMAADPEVEISLEKAEQ
jgi:ferredoxin